MPVSELPPLLLPVHLQTGLPACYTPVTAVCILTYAHGVPAYLQVPDGG